MSNVLITRKGAGGTLSGAFAVISVSYPAGSACALSKDSTVLRDPMTAGTAMFAVPEAGTWTVAVTNGTATKTRTVTITERGQVERCVIAYGDALFSPNSGSEQRWMTFGNATAGSESIQVNGGVDAAAFAYLKEAVSMAGRTTLTLEAAFTVTTRSQSLSAPAYLYLVSENYDPRYAPGAVLIQQITAGDHTGSGAYELDISGLDRTKKYFVTLYTSGAGAEGETATSQLTVTGVDVT